MPVAAAIVGASVIKGGATMIASSKAAKAQRKAAESAAQTARETFDKQAALQEPFRQAGLTAQEQIMQLLGIGGDKTAEGYGSLAKPFGMDQFNVDPGYAFRQSEGMKALERSAAARGGLLSGSALKGIQRFGQDLASQEYQNAFNRYQIERAARLNPLQSLMGSGQSAANTLTNAAGNMGANVANSQLAAGQARASGYVGMGNAISGIASGIENAFTQVPLYNAQINYLNSLSGGGGGNFGSSIANNAMAGINGYLAGSPYTASNYGLSGFGGGR